MHSRQHAPRYAKELAQFFAPVHGPDIEQHRARRVGRVRGVHSTAGEVPNEPAIHRACQQLTATGAGGNAVLRQHPFELGRGKIGIDHEPGPFGDRVGLRRELGTSRRRTPVLPHDRPAHRGARRSIPQDHGLTLVGDADRVGRHTRPSDRLAGRVERAVQEIVWIVFHPPRLRKMLRDFPVPAADHATIVGHDQTGRAGRTLVDSEDVLHDEDFMTKSRRVGDRRRDP